jgi:hypothetical protein
MTLSKHSPNRANFVHKVIAFRDTIGRPRVCSLGTSGKYTLKPRRTSGAFFHAALLETVVCIGGWLGSGGGKERTGGAATALLCAAQRSASSSG